MKKERRKEKKTLQYNWTAKMAIQWIEIQRASEWPMNRCPKRFFPFRPNMSAITISSSLSLSPSSLYIKGWKWSALNWYHILLHQKLHFSTLERKMYFKPTDFFFSSLWVSRYRSHQHSSNKMNQAQKWQTSLHSWCPFSANVNFFLLFPPLS